MSGTHYNGKCCFDYGNSENNQLVPWRGGAGSMEAIYFGNAHWLGNTGDGDTGPWIGADLEAGMYYGGGNATKVRMCYTCIRARMHSCAHAFVHARVRTHTHTWVDACLCTRATPHR